MTYINYKHNNWNYLIETLAEYENRIEASIALIEYKQQYNASNTYLSSRCTNEWKEIKNKLTKQI